MKKVLLILLIVFIMCGLTGCYNKETNKNTERVITGIIAKEYSIDIIDGKVKLPNFEKTVLNKKTNLTNNESIDISKLKFFNSKKEELIPVNNEVSVPNEDDIITVIYKENDKEFTITIDIKVVKKYISFGSSTLYYGKYKSEGDLPSGFNGVITINSDGTASYEGSKLNENNGKTKKVNLSGTWEVKEKSIGGLQGSPYESSKVNGIKFTWSDGTVDAYGVSDKYFGNQFMGYRLIGE